MTDYLKSIGFYTLSDDRTRNTDVFPALQAKARSFDSQAAFQKMLDGYFNAIWEVL